MDVLFTYPMPPASVKREFVNGRGEPALKSLSKSQRAATAVAVIRGDVFLRPTIQVVARALDVSVSYVVQAARLSPRELLQMRCGHGELAWSAKRSPAPEPTSIEDRFALIVGELGGVEMALAALARFEVGRATAAVPADYRFFPEPATA